MKRKKSLYLLSVLLVIAFALLGCDAPAGNDTDAESGLGLPLPSEITIASEMMGGPNMVAASALGEFIREKEGIAVHTIPGENPINRLGMLREGFADVGFSGHHFDYTWGGLEAAHPDWGPQSLRLLAIGEASWGQIFVTSDPENIKTVADLKGRRIGSVLEGGVSDFYNQAMLNVGGLTLDDVEIVRYSSVTDMSDGFMRGETDATYMVPNAGRARELEAHRIGLHYVQYPTPEENPEGWATANELLHGILYPLYMNYGAGVSEENPLLTISLPYPALFSYSNLDDNYAYHLTRILVEHAEEYRELDPGGMLSGFSLEQQVPLLDMPVPFHDGSVKYWEEVGVWTDELEAHRQELIQRQEDMRQLFEDTLSEVEGENLSDEEFKELWLKKAYGALSNK